jgi:hypothetical protein
MPKYGRPKKGEDSGLTVERLRSLVRSRWSVIEIAEKYELTRQAVYAKMAQARPPIKIKRAPA